MERSVWWLMLRWLYFLNIRFNTIIFRIIFHNNSQQRNIDHVFFLFQVKIFTSHCSPTHSFPETQDGTLNVTVVGDFLPRHIFHKGYALCAYIRMLYVSLYVALFHRSADAIFCDSISFPIPVLKTVAPVLFYCHFPDKLLCTDRGSLLKRIYRAPIDWVEGVTTRQADKLFVNSKFTQGIFSNSFPEIQPLPDVLYPPLSLKKFDTPITDPPAVLASLSSALVPASTIPTSGENWLYLKEQHKQSTPFPEKYLLSINRFERKKNIELAIHTFSELIQKPQSSSSQPLSLILAGGYDSRVTENVEYTLELARLAKELSVQDRVFFLFSFSDDQKLYLLGECLCVLYTPSNEHFGIVPIETMFRSKPVIAVNSGGPTESVVNGTTGYLCDPDGKSFAKAVTSIMEGGEPRSQKMGQAGRQRVIDLFSLNAFQENLTRVVDSVIQEKKTGFWGISFLFGLFAMFVGLLGVYFYL